MDTASKAASKPAARRRPRKVTYSLPAEILDRLDRASGSARAKSGIVAEALELYFSQKEKQALEAEFADAASDPRFIEDNRAILRDFAALDREIERRKP